MEARGHNGRIIFDGRVITIDRATLGGKLSQGTGYKVIPLRTVSGLQWKPAGWILNGYIAFTIPGAIEQTGKPVRGVAAAVKDENTVIFTKQQTAAFEAIRNAIQYELSRIG